MNVAATRLILLNGDRGHEAAGSVIKAFGEFVVGGNYIIGFVMFVVISIVNLKVITKGSGRIAEVAARFTLDGMPGKQMAIDSDLNTGIIKETEARQRRKEVQQEAEFYGSMDGAAKFVSGDAVAGVFITGINIVGGLIIGVAQKGMDWLTAAQTYSLLTIGDGLVSQIPAIIISTAAGLIVTRAGSGEDLNADVFRQLSGSVRPLFLTSAVCGGFALVPGLPFFPFMLLSVGVAAVGFVRRRVIAEALVKPPKIEAAPDENAPKPGSTEEVLGLLGLDTLELELGFELVHLVDGGDLVERIRNLRRQFATEYGFIVPPIHIKDNVRIPSAEYRLVLRGAIIARGDLKPRYLLAMDPGTVASPLQGIPTREPAFGLDALWIPEHDKERAQFMGYTVVDLTTVVATHMTEIIRGHMHELLGRQEVQQLLDNVAKDSPKVLEELVPTHLSVGQVQQVLQTLLREQVSIRDLKGILETLGDWAPTVKHPERLAEFVRRRMSRVITARYTSQAGVLPLASIAAPVERQLADAVQQTDEGSFLALDPPFAQLMIGKLTKLSEKFLEQGYTPLLLVPAHLRAALARFCERFTPGFAVISHSEVAPNVRVQSLGVISMEG
jgi:flagellar biosynthesis protein FlhA